jgi:hypothetical protein
MSPRLPIPKRFRRRSTAKRGGADERSCVARTLRALKRYDVRPEQIDDIILDAINVSLCLDSDGDALVAEGFNNDIVINGRAFGRH